MPGIYRKVRHRQPVGSVKGAVFLDRDGVIVTDPGYLHSPELIEYLPGALEAIRDLNAAGFPVVVVTNQAGVGRGYYGWDDFERVQQAIDDKLAGIGGWIDGVWACAFHEDGLNEYKIANHPWRKPNPGMLLDASAAMNLNLSHSSIVGDKIGDILAGIRAGVKCAVHVETGYGLEDRESVSALTPSSTDLVTCADLATAVNRLLTA